MSRRVLLLRVNLLRPDATFILQRAVGDLYGVYMNRTSHFIRAFAAATLGITTPAYAGGFFDDIGNAINRVAIDVGHAVGKGGPVTPATQSKRALMIPAMRSKRAWAIRACDRKWHS
jgi:hypothetical protein